MIRTASFALGHSFLSVRSLLFHRTFADSFPHQNCSITLLMPQFHKADYAEVPSHFRCALMLLHIALHSDPIKTRHYIVRPDNYSDVKFHKIPLQFFYSQLQPYNTGAWRGFCRFPNCRAPSQFYMHCRHSPHFEPFVPIASPCAALSTETRIESIMLPNFSKQTINLKLVAYLSSIFSNYKLFMGCKFISYNHKM